MLHAIHHMRSRGYFQKGILTLPLPGIHLTILEGQNVADKGELAQMVERPLSMREVPGSIPGFSIFF